MTCNAHSNAPGLVLRPVTTSDERAVRAVARLHMELLGFGPMAGLGERFIREIGYRLLMRDGVLRVVLAAIDGEPVGFAAYTERSFSFHRTSLHKHPVRVAWTLMRSILEERISIASLVRALRVLRSRRGELAQGGDPLGELIAIAVRRPSLSSGLARSAGLRVSEALVSHVQRVLARAGVDEMRMLVDDDNKAALFLYHRMGGRMRPGMQAGKPVVEVRFNLETTSPELDLPACWCERGAPSAPALSWPNYWERLEDNQPLFRAEAHDFVSRLCADFEIRGRVLDFGCGFGWCADDLAPLVEEMAVWDAAANMRKHARLRLARHANVQFIDLSTPACDASAGHFDYILVNSVIQYMNEDELLDWLQRWRRLLAPRGQLVISDMVGPENHFSADLAALFWFGFRQQILFASMVAGLRGIGGYREVNATIPLLKLALDDLGRLAGRAGMTVTAHHRNLTYRQSRTSAILRAA